MVSASSTLKSTQISPEWIPEKKGRPMPQNNSFICNDLQVSFAVVWTEAVYVCIFFSLTLTCLLNEKSSTLNVSSTEKNQCTVCRNCRCLCVQVWNLWNKRSRKTIPKKVQYDTKIYCVCCLCVL